MSNEKKNRDGRRGLSGGFLFFLLAMVLVFFAVQTLTGEKEGKVSFSYQLEHLVNLNLIQPDKSHKIAQNDNLVTFTGKFRDRETEEGKERFEYLTLLNDQHQFQQEKKHLDQELDALKSNVSAAAIQFLEISGLSASSKGFTVVSSLYDTPARINAIQIEDHVSAQAINLASLEQHAQAMKSAPGEAQLTQMKAELVLLTKYYSSAKLGIGDSVLKQKVKEIQNKLIKASAELSATEQMTLYLTSLNELKQVTQSIAKEHEGVRLLALRSVRNYVEAVDQYNLNEKSLVKNTALLQKARQKVADVTWFFNNKELSTRALEKEDSESYSQWYSKAKEEWESFAMNKGLVFKSPDQPRNTVLERSFKSQEPPHNYFNYIVTILPIALIALFIYFIFSRQMKGVGSSAMNFGKSPAKLLTKETNHITFKDVAGAQEAKEELEEIVDFLKDPQKFTALGARIPKGVLLVGPPGTGKTLVAKAVSGEADRPFFSISGSDFVEMFVGVGASRIRDLFDQAKKQAPCIIFMDEIDAVGRHRGAGIGGGHDEREQTLNQLLVEMDGFDTKEGVILMAATNRPDILDKALLRPGRFDRRVTLDLPDVKGRFDILKVHARKIKIDASVNLMDVARNTPGSSGADLANILNEAALLAARRGRSAVTAGEVIEACDKVRFGKERRSLEMDTEEKRTTAYHESGHALVGLVVEHGDPVDKVTIIPRGFSLGATHFMPKKNRLSYWRKEALDQLAILLGGRAAEEIFIQDMSSGAQQDIVQATKLARAMVCEWGMSDLGTIAFDERQSQGQYLGMNGYNEKLYSEETAQSIDKAVHQLIDEAHTRAITIVNENHDKVEKMAQMLMEFETLDSQDIKEIMDGTWNEEEKKKRLKEAEELHKHTPPPPPDEDTITDHPSPSDGFPAPEQT